MNTDSTLEKEVEEFLKSHNLQDSLKYLKDTIPSSINNESKGFLHEKLFNLSLSSGIGLYDIAEKAGDFYESAWAKSFTTSKDQNSVFNDKLLLKKARKMFNLALRYCPENSSSQKYGIKRKIEDIDSQLKREPSIFRKALILFVFSSFLISIMMFSTNITGLVISEGSSNQRFILGTVLFFFGLVGIYILAK